MIYKQKPGYQNNPLMNSISKQIAFLFGRIIYFIEEADRLRLEKRFEEFAEYNQRAFSIVHGLTAFFETELNEQAINAWNIFFLKLLARLNQHMIEPNPILFIEICDSLREMEQQLKNVDTKNHIHISQKALENELPTDDINELLNESADNKCPPELVQSTIPTDLNLSV